MRILFIYVLVFLFFVFCGEGGSFFGGVVFGPFLGFELSASALGLLWVWFGFGLGLVWVGFGLGWFGLVLVGFGLGSAKVGKIV